jgi:biopolymer transport protein ExbD
LVKNKSVSKIELERLLKKYKKQNPKGQIFLQADKMAAHGIVVEVLDTIRKSGIYAVSIGTSKGAGNS